jgi:hypothetical protein
VFKAYFRSDPASHSALTRCAFSDSDIVSFHSATIVGLKLSKPHDHNSVKLAMGGMPDHGMRLQHCVAAYANLTARRNRQANSLQPCSQL